jgi:hypothetical protein
MAGHASGGVAQEVSRMTKFSWWVNQNKTYDFEVPGGFLWSPKTNKNGAKNQFYDNMTLVKPGDLFFHFAIQRSKQ